MHLSWSKSHIKVGIFDLDLWPWVMNWWQNLSSPITQRNLMLTGVPSRPSALESCHLFQVLTVVCFFTLCNVWYKASVFDLLATKMSHVHIGLSLTDHRFDHKPQLLLTLVQNFHNLVIQTYSHAFRRLMHYRSIMLPAWNLVYSASVL